MRVKVKLFQKLFLPSSVIGGIVGLIILQIAGAYIPPVWTMGWSKLPGFLINIVFASLFLGVVIPSLRTIWQRSGPQLAYGQIVTFGEYVVGLGLVMFGLKYIFKIPEIFGVVIPVGFEGGHGTAAGLRQTFTDLSWPEGTDLGLTAATVGMVSAILVGIALLNWAARKGYITKFRNVKDMTDEEKAGIYPVNNRPIAGLQTVNPKSIDSLAFHLAIIGIAVFVGYGIKELFLVFDRSIPCLHRLGLIESFPIFPLCMIGGLIVQLGFLKFSKSQLIDYGLMQRLAGTALDFLVVAAISTICLKTIARDMIPFMIVVAGGIAWNVFCVMWLARRILPDCWFERAIAEMGQSMGVTATGLLLLRIADPENETNALSAFGYKQMLHEPFMGGGLWTSTAIILVARHGGWLVLGLSIAGIGIWLIVWKLLWGRKGQRSVVSGQ